MGDAKFSDSLELMTFLANLVGSEHIERFIPVAEAAERARPSPRRREPRPDEHARRPAAATRHRHPGNARSSSAPSAHRRRPATATGRAHANARPPAPPKPAPKAAGQATVNCRADEAGGGGNGRTAPAPRREAAREQVIADAARLVQWGRKWYELPELIARMADRPPLPDVRRILKENKAAIEKKAGNA